jgi:hypothetical protein
MLGLCDLVIVFNYLNVIYLYRIRVRHLRC